MIAYKLIYCMIRLVPIVCMCDDIFVCSTKWLFLLHAFLQGEPEAIALALVSSDASLAWLPTYSL